MPRECGVEECVIRVNELKHAAVLREHMLEKKAGFFAHGVFNVVSVISAVLFRVGRHLAELAQVQPLLGKVFAEGRGARIFEHAFDLRPQSDRSFQPA